jgi:hypothetical protein
MAAEDPSGVARVQPRMLSRALIEIKCTGHLLGEDTAYLPHLAQLIESQAERVNIVFETLGIDGYSPEFPMRHIDFFKQWRARIHKIAVVHSLKSIAFAVATVSLASNTNIKGFSSLPDALSWLRSA